MIELISEFFRLVQSVLAIAAGADSGLMVLVFGATAVAVVVVIVARALPVLVAADASRAAQRLRQTADPSRLLSQSDPDAPGRARPRAPGSGIPAV